MPESGFTMKQDLESSIERDACDYAKKQGWMVFKFVSPGRRGVPDRLFIRDGRHLFIEFKRPDGEARQQQRKRHSDMRAHGAEVYVVDNLKEAYDILR